MQTIATFESLADEFKIRTDRIVWCSMATSDAARRIRSRIVHPVWDGCVGWLLTDRHSHKARDVDGNPWTSLIYIDSAQEQVHVDCRTSWESRESGKKRLWD
jgi:pyridoxine/pyridoxamine 5'-phosphate oxidase